MLCVRQPLIEQHGVRSHGLQQLIELEVAAVLGADRHERSE